MEAGASEKAFPASDLERENIYLVGAGGLFCIAPDFSLWGRWGLKIIKSRAIISWLPLRKHLRTRLLNSSGLGTTGINSLHGSQTGFSGSTE
ncbi:MULTISPECIES: hypothetical protein [Cyanophyceae]|uniref:hypothetical protein n=1 Tax=Cyanophyceae TaxID=3028117 RepID=UPI00168335D9|nr:hypothetical protein [Trichocoleus sp. FACHB-40]MBD2002273.1 hypothetical protein [Trichocoleus sp. FACHB-40]